MAAVMIELAQHPGGDDGIPLAAPVGDDEVEFLDDVEELGAYARCSCAASDDQPY